MVSNEELVRELEQTPELKRRLVVRIAHEILESEAFLEAYPRVDIPEQLTAIFTRILHKNRVNTADGRAVFAKLAQTYTGRVR